VWERLSNSNKRDYIVYHYCERNRSIERTKERESNGVFTFRYE
jgi:hypothetical protein